LSHLSLLFILSFVSILPSCSNTDHIDSQQFVEWKTIEGRDDGHSAASPPPIYRAKVPKDWISAPQREGSLIDTTLPIAEFYVREGDQQIRLTVHNFPADTLDQRVAPLSQIMRWKRQFDEFDSSSLSICPEAHGGFAGFAFECTGTLKHQPTTILGWSMQLDPEHFQSLKDGSNHQRQMRADYTIKAVGPPSLITQHRHDLLTFANSFELIQEIPHDL
jgi:hypothetical protein